MGGTNLRFSKAGDFANNQHICGTLSMGNDPRTSVCDGWGRADDHDMLFLAGTGVMPTCGTCNSTENAVALALRTVAHILQGRGAGARQASPAAAR
jgi:choline dehydrogenase-like flavoprotein